MQHADTLVFVAHDIEIVSGVQLARCGVNRFEDLCVLVVGHCFCSIDVTSKQSSHVELLLNERYVSGGIETGLGQSSEDFKFVAVAPVTDVLTSKVCRRGDALVLERDLQGTRTLEDLCDVHDVRTSFTACESLRNP